ncbi:oligosaccharide flippase family protein [Legionella quateirensis]|uniref:Polysaccharide biosynthesis protein n=1 Tax=Legionella quateirensis TaxID=45072 RepID=A0A378KVP4_9GAMM|nr:oligosaccharide flippase family protein [Legionella quateirensis]KTD46316.1 hypothetical protein Lqua_2419 [Legionella quateirensis]STY18914.1 Uncharacterised protein [Legionella quateirensis]
MELTLRQVARDVYFLFILAVLGYLTKYALNLFLAHHLTPIRYGEYSVAIKLLDILVLITLFGTNVGASRFLAEYLELNSLRSAVDYIAWNIKLISVTFSIMLFISIIALILMSSLHYLGIHDISRYHLFVYILCVVPIAAIPALLQSFLLCSQHIYSPTILSQIVLYALQLLIFGIISFFVIHPLDSITIATVILISFLLVTFITVLTMNTELWSIVILGIKKINHTEILNPAWIKASSRWIINTLIFQLISILDLIIVYVVGKNKLYVGYYAAVLTIIYLIWLLPATLYQGIKPKISNLLSSESGRLELQSLLNKTNAVVIFILLVLSGLIIYFSTNLLSFFGPTYVAAKSALIILTFGACLGACTKIATLLLIYADFESTVVKIRGTQLVLMFVLVIPATYFYNITGTATATAIVMCVAPVVSIWIVHTKLRLNSVFIF